MWSRSIDENITAPYSIQFTDLDLDGNDEMVVNTHEGGEGGSIYAYILPKDSDL